MLPGRIVYMGTRKLRRGALVAAVVAGALGVTAVA
jgi:hypothetical protein